MGKWGRKVADSWRAVMDVESFEEIESEFTERVSKIVWCSVATVDSKGRPRSRILHPIWEGATGWIATNRHSFKERHLALNPHVSLTYTDNEHRQVYADCVANWEDDVVQKARIWELYKTAPEPLGYDPGLIWQTPKNPDYGLLRLTPWRIEISGMPDFVAGQPARVWRSREDSQS